MADNLGAPKSERSLKILDALLSLEEALRCLELFTPAMCTELAGRLNLNEEDLSSTLDSLVDCGMLTRGETQFAFHTTLLFFYHECVADTAPHTGPHTISKKVKDLWNDFFRHEWSYMFMEHTIEMIKVTGRSLPIWPAIGAL